MLQLQLLHTSLQFVKPNATATVATHIAALIDLTQTQRQTLIHRQDD